MKETALILFNFCHFNGHKSAHDCDQFEWTKKKNKEKVWKKNSKWQTLKMKSKMNLLIERKI